MQVQPVFRVKIHPLFRYSRFLVNAMGAKTPATVKAMLMKYGEVNAYFKPTGEPMQRVMAQETTYSQVRELMNCLIKRPLIETLQLLRMVQQKFPPAFEHKESFIKIVEVVKEEVTAAEEHDRENIQRPTCAVCNVAPVSHMATPCNHVCRCFACSKNVTSCPRCLSPGVSFIVVHF